MCEKIVCISKCPKSRWRCLDILDPMCMMKTSVRYGVSKSDGKKYEIRRYMTCSHKIFYILVYSIYFKFFCITPILTN